jgi:hypothetical protein
MVLAQNNERADMEKHSPIQGDARYRWPNIAEFVDIPLSLFGENA